MPVRTITDAELAVWVSEHVERTAASVEAIREHNAVVVAGMTETVTPVPIRFGQWLSDEEAARASLRTSHEEWLTLLGRFAGAVEYGIRIFDPAREAPADGAEPKPVTGTEYMAALARKQSAGAGSQAVAALARAVEGVILEEKVEPLRTAHGIASVAHLVRNSRLDAYRSAVEAARAEMPRLRLLSTGPWPPYSFVA
jgi:hypothetical protein